MDNGKGALARRGSLDRSTQQDYDHQLQLVYLIPTVVDVHSLAGWIYLSYRVLLAPLTIIHVGKITEESLSYHTRYAVVIRRVLAAYLLRAGTSHKASYSE